MLPTKCSSVKVKLIVRPTSVTPNGILPTYRRLAWRLIALPANGMVVFRVIATCGTLMDWGIWPAATMSFNRVITSDKTDTGKSISKQFTTKD